MTDETGLSRRHQERARKVLLSQGVVQEDKRGIPRRLWYWIDFAALVGIMEDPHSTLNQWARKQEKNAAETTNEMDSANRNSITDHADEIDSMAQASRIDSTHPASEDDSRAPASEEDTTHPPITESTAQTTAESSSENYSAENENFQFSKDHDSRGLLPKEDMNLANPLRPSMGELLQRIYNLLDNSDSAAYRAYERHREGSLSLQDLAGEVCFALTGSRDNTELCIELVRRLVDDLAIDDGMSH
jgi:DNA-binding transcriptional regulator YdaS (Cro superfamily)